MKVKVYKEEGQAINPYNMYEGNLNPKWEEFNIANPKYPSPRIPNGTHECELVCEKYENGKWTPCYDPESTTCKTRQVFILSPLKEQGERRGVRTTTDFFERPHVRHGWK